MIESERLLLRQMDQEDFGEIARMLRDPEVMYAWGHPFSDEAIRNWIQQQLERYRKDGIGFLLALDKGLNQTVGQIGLLRLDFKGTLQWDLGYLLLKEHWGKGYATEGAAACLDYAFRVLGAEKVLCDMRPMNKASIAVAERLGMKRTGMHVKRYNGEDMPHLLYEISGSEYGNWKDARKTRK